MPLTFLENCTSDDCPIKEPHPAGGKYDVSILAKDPEEGKNREDVSNSLHFNLPKPVETAIQTIVSSKSNEYSPSTTLVKQFAAVHHIDTSFWWEWNKADDFKDWPTWKDLEADDRRTGQYAQVSEPHRFPNLEVSSTGLKRHLKGTDGSHHGGQLRKQIFSIDAFVEAVRENMPLDQITEWQRAFRFGALVKEEKSDHDR
ncbi:hypothetical protein MMC28_006271 [Mycoblastus sanguinarius]|nr:hypothetical protein [Mycoblastus sanguinarius]